MDFQILCFLFSGILRRITVIILYISKYFATCWVDPNKQLSGVYHSPVTPPTLMCTLFLSVLILKYLHIPKLSPSSLCCAFKHTQVVHQCIGMISYITIYYRYYESCIPPNAHTVNVSLFVMTDELKDRYLSRITCFITIITKPILHLGCHHSQYLHF